MIASPVMNVIADKFFCTWMSAKLQWWLYMMILGDSSHLLKTQVLR